MSVRNFSCERMIYDHAVVEIDSRTKKRCARFLAESAAVLLLISGGDVAANARDQDEPPASDHTVIETHE